MKGFKTYRHERNPKEKEFHDTFVKEHNRRGYQDMDLIVFGHESNTLLPSDTLTNKEQRIVVSTIQWLGSPVGDSFLRSCGYKLVDEGK